MKIIDLLNKIANDEKVPEEIIYNNLYYYWCNQCKMYERIKDGKRKVLYNEFNELNDEIEIIEEKKIPEKLCYFDLTKDKNEKDENGNDLELHYTGVADTFDDVYEKINEIIDYLDYLISKGK